MSISKRLAVLAIALQVTGLGLAALLVVPVMFQRDASAYAAPTSLTNISQSKRSVSDPKVVSGLPEAVSVPRLGINTSVRGGNYNPSNATWDIGEDAAYFAEITDRPNDASGMTFIYGHNSQSVFGNLRQNIQNGIMATVKTTNGYEFTYRFSELRDVSPEDVANLRASTEKSVLILQTCTGFLNQSRRLVYFEFVKYTKTDA